MPKVRLEFIETRDDINCRVSERTAGIDALAASILAHGLLNPIQVRVTGAGYYEVVDGNRRATAIKLLRKRGEWQDDVEVIDLGSISDDEARELSLAANIIREDIHPIDEFEAFAKMASAMKVSEIAAHFGKTEKAVRQRLALGGLHPELRALWREGGINDDTAQAFTLCRDQDAQIETYRRMKAENKGIWSNNVRASLGMDWDARKALGVIGIEAYEAAGGSVTEDLFGDDDILSDPGLAKRLLAEKIDNVCAGLVADGWGFAKIRSDVKNPWGWAKIKPTGKREPTPEEQAELDSIIPQIETLEAEDDGIGGLTDERQELLDKLTERRDAIEEQIDVRRWGVRQKRSAGCFVYVDGDRLAIEYGMVDPASQKKTSKDSVDADEDENDADENADVEGHASGDDQGKIGLSMILALSEQLTKAAHDVLLDHPDIALPVAIAAIETSFGSSPARIKADGAPCVAEVAHGGMFEDLLRELIAIKDQAGIDARLSAAVAQSLDLRIFVNRDQEGGNLALLRALPQDQLVVACRKHFDAEHYFKGVKADLCNAALDEMGVERAGRPKKKGEIAELCVTKAKESGWLPSQMRMKQEG